jgi:hypothetical protein
VQAAREVINETANQNAGLSHPFVGEHSGSHKGRHIRKICCFENLEKIELRPKKKKPNTDLFEGTKVLDVAEEMRLAVRSVRASQNAPELVFDLDLQFSAMTNNTPPNSRSSKY